jgi:hypothetical protein
MLTVCVCVCVCVCRFLDAGRAFVLLAEVTAPGDFSDLDLEKAGSSFKPFHTPGQLQWLRNGVCILLPCEHIFLASIWSEMDI